MRNIFALASIAALLASPSLAQNSVTSWSNGNYDITGSAVGEDPSCIMTSTFTIAGRADVAFALLLTGDDAIFALTSTDWSAVQGQVYEGFAYYFPEADSLFNGGVTRGYVHRSIEKGFVTSFGPDFLDRLAAENRLVVGRQPEGGEVVIVADLNLIGTGTAVAALRRCATHVTQREAARIRRENRNDYIARDPFAN